MLEQGAAVTMVTDQDIAQALENLLREANPNFATFTSLHDVVQQLESKLGFSLAHKLDFIRNHIHFLLRPPPPPPPKDHFPLQQHPIFHPPPPQNFAPERSSQDLVFRPHHPTPQYASPTPAPAGLPAVQPPKKSAQKVKRRRGGPGGLNKLCGVSPLLQPIVGHPTLPRTEIVKQLWIYIRKNNLQDPSNKRKIVCNDELRLVLETDSTDMFKMNKLLAKHIIPLEPTKPTNRVSKKLKAAVVPESEPESMPESKPADIVPIVIVSEELASFFGTDEREMSQAEVLRQIWEYIKVNQLEDPSNAMVILCDAKLQELLKCKSVSALGIPEMLARYHLCKKSLPDPADWPKSHSSRGQTFSLIISSPSFLQLLPTSPAAIYKTPAMSKLQTPVISILLLCFTVFASAQRSANTTSLWKTLNGDSPVAIARGGFSGIFPDSSMNAYTLALITGLSNMILWCDVQLTSDGAGICMPELTLNNASDIAYIFKNNSNTYLVNGARRSGWFSVDFSLDDLTNVSLTQGIYSRSQIFDQSFFKVVTVQYVARQLKPSGLWLNIQHDAFFSQHNLSMRSFVLSTSRSVIVNYISSPEVNFLRSIVTRFKPSPTKLVFRFLGQNDVEPSTNQTYGSLLKNLTFIKTFASGILVPKTYIWPLDKDLYLQPHTSLALDAHKEGLEIFASEFSNDVPFAYDYNYDPVAEYLNFIDNDNFSVDGVLSDFPITPSEAIDCFAHMDKNVSGSEIPLIISHEGASGEYPGCTDLAYEKAIADGVDVIDCPVQMTKDGIPFCLGSINLIDRTTAAQSFSNLVTNIPELNADGIFSFNLNWSDIQSLKPVITNPWLSSTLYRNPRNKNAGNLVALSEFLTLANNATSVSGVLIRIENASYLAEKQGLGVTDAVLDALSKAGYNNQTRKRVMIQSSNSAVLIKVKEKNQYELVYEVEEEIRDALNSTIVDIAKFANSLVINKKSVYSLNSEFLTGATDVVSKLHAFKLPVYVEVFQNEFLAQAWDFFSDAYVELNSYVSGSGVDGVITDFPGTANKYRRNRCLLEKDTPSYMTPVGPGSLLTVSETQPPAVAPSPVLTVDDVTEPPFPAVALKPNSDNGTDGGATAPPPAQPSGQAKVTVGILVSTLAILLAALSPF